MSLHAFRNICFHDGYLLEFYSSVIQHMDMVEVGDVSEMHVPPIFRLINLRLSHQ
jgi:hypothetical protein